MQMKPPVDTFTCWPATIPLLPSNSVLINLSFFLSISTLFNSLMKTFHCKKEKWFKLKMCVCFDWVEAPRSMCLVTDDAVKVLHSVCQQIWKAQQWPQDWKRSVFIPIPKKGNPKDCSNYRTIVLISHTSKVMHKILQARLQQYVNCELPDVQAGFRKGRGTRDQTANICWIIEKAREFQKNICFID